MTAGEARYDGHSDWYEETTGAGLRLRVVRELSGGGVVLPRNLAVVAEKA
jgi:hypothetical protein